MLTPDDIELYMEEDHLEVRLINPSKRLHEGKGTWKYVEPEELQFLDPDAIGVINFYKGYSAVDVEIRFALIEILPQYRNTIVFRTLFNQFDKLVDEVLKNDCEGLPLSVTAYFENPDFKSFMFKWAAEKGIGIEDDKTGELIPA